MSAADTARAALIRIGGLTGSRAQQQEIKHQWCIELRTPCSQSKQRSDETGRAENTDHVV